MKSMHAAGMLQILDRAMEAIRRSQQGNKNVLCYGHCKVPCLRLILPTAPPLVQFTKCRCM